MYSFNGNLNQRDTSQENLINTSDDYNQNWLQSMPFPHTPAIPFYETLYQHQTPISTIPLEHHPYPLSTNLPPISLHPLSTDMHPHIPVIYTPLIESSHLTQPRKKPRVAQALYASQTTANIMGHPKPSTTEFHSIARDPRSKRAVTHNVEELLPPEEMCMHILDTSLKTLNTLEEQLDRLENLSENEINILGIKVINDIKYKKIVHNSIFSKSISFKEFIILARYCRSINKARNLTKVHITSIQDTLAYFGLAFSELLSPLPKNKFAQLLNVYGKEFEQNLLFISLYKIKQKLQRIEVNDPKQLIKLISQANSKADFALQLMDSQENVINKYPLETKYQNYYEYCDGEDLAHCNFKTLKKICESIVADDFINKRRTTTQENPNQVLKDVATSVSSSSNAQFIRVQEEVITRDTLEPNIQEMDIPTRILTEEISIQILDAKLKTLNTLDTQLDYLSNLSDNQNSILCIEIVEKIKKRKKINPRYSLIDIISFKEFLIFARYSKNLKKAVKISNISKVNIQDSLAYFGLTFNEMSELNDLLKNKFAEILNLYGKEFEKDFISTTLIKIVEQLPKIEINNPLQLISLISQSNSLTDLSVRLRISQRNVVNMYPIKTIHSNFHEYCAGQDLTNSDFKTLKNICDNIVKDHDINLEAQQEYSSLTPTNSTTVYAISSTTPLHHAQQEGAVTDTFSEQIQETIELQNAINPKNDILTTEASNDLLINYIDSSVFLDDEIYDDTMEHHIINFLSQSQNAEEIVILEQTKMEILNKELEQKPLVAQLDHLDNLSKAELSILVPEITDKIKNLMKYNPRYSLVNIISFKEFIILARYTKSLSQARALTNLGIPYIQGALAYFGLSFKELSVPRCLPIAKFEAMLDSYGQEFEKEFLFTPLINIKQKLPKIIINSDVQLISLIAESNSLIELSIRLRMPPKKVIRMYPLETIEKHYHEYCSGQDLTNYDFKTLKQISENIVADGFINKRIKAQQIIHTQETTFSIDPSSSAFTQFFYAQQILEGPQTTNSSFPSNELLPVSIANSEFTFLSSIDNTNLETEVAVTSCQVSNLNEDADSLTPEELAYLNNLDNLPI